jgi:hypothetical protein
VAPEGWGGNVPPGRRTAPALLSHGAYSVDACDNGHEHVTQAADAHLVEDLQSELCPFSLLDLDAQHIAGAIGQHAQCEVDHFVAPPLHRDLHPLGIEEQYRIDRFLRPALLRCELSHHIIGNLADEVGRDFGFRSPRFIKPAVVRLRIGSLVKIGFVTSLRRPDCLGVT